VVLIRMARGLFTMLSLAMVVLMAVADSTTAPVETRELPDANELIAGAIDLTRGLTSYAEMSMVIHRPDWERSSSMHAWTRGREEALIRFTAPAKDAGNATLKDAEKMWTYTPKLNRVIRLPYSMMSQGWAGSDFSYNDLSRSDTLLHEYQLTVTHMEEVDGHIVYTIEAIPHDTAPVVWGKEVVVLRDDYVLLEQTFYDQAMLPLKQLVGSEIKQMGDRVFATRMRMSNLEKPDQWTEMLWEKADFDVEVDDGMFTVFALKSGRSR
jgi:outer membrane lipoprotein-sorting protein